MSKICMKCGNILSNEAMFCARCGKSLSQDMNHQQINQGKQSMNSQWNHQNQQEMNYNQWNYQNQQETNHNQWNQSDWQGMNNQAERQQAIHINTHQIKNNLMQKRRKLLSGGNKKLVGIGIGIAAIFIVLLVMFILGRTPSNYRLKEQFPMDLLSYKYIEDDEEKAVVKTSEIKSFKVERRTSGRDNDTAYCRVELEDELMTRVLYVEMHSQKYTRGGWNVTYCSIYQTDEIIPHMPPTDVINKGIAEFNSDDGTITNVQEIKNDDCSYTYTVNYVLEQGSGPVSFTCKLSNYSELQAESLKEVKFPMEYYWRATDIDSSKFNLKLE